MSDITYTLTPYQRARRATVSEYLGRPLSDAEGRLVDAAGDVMKERVNALDTWSVLSAILSVVMRGARVGS